MADSALTNRSPSLSPGKNLTFTNGTFSFGSSAIVTCTAAYTVLVTDDIVVCNSTAAYTVTLFTSVGNAGNSKKFINIGTSKVTLDGSGAETIDGTASIILYPGQTIEIYPDGSNWRSIKEQGKGRVLISEQTFSGVANVDFIDIGNYNEYELVLDDILPVTNAAQLQMRFSTDNGSTFISSTGAYITQEQATVGVGVGAGLSTLTVATLSQGISNSSGDGGSFIIRFIGTRSATSNTRFLSFAKGINNLPAHASWIYFGERDADEAHNAIRILMSSGNMSGVARFYGMF
jgi:hypothetical protein